MGNIIKVQNCGYEMSRKSVAIHPVALEKIILEVDMNSGKNLGGMTVNERLFALNLFEEWD